MNLNASHRNRTEGRVVDCDGQRAIIMADVQQDVEFMENYWAVGQLVSIHEGGNRIVGQTYKVESAEARWADKAANTLLVHIELIGEIQQRQDGSLHFSGGITDYPRMGAVAHRIRSADLEAMYADETANTINVGTLTQDQSIPARVNCDRLMTRHFAVVGTTGVGKSSAVSLILRKVIEMRPELRVLILDPHNEFVCAFPSQSVVKNAGNLHLPFWLFQFDELREVVFRGQKGLGVETELLRDLITEAKERYAEAESAAATPVRRASARMGYTADSPVPFRLADVFRIIEERLGLLEGKSDKPVLKSLRDRLTSISNDPRFAFTFGNANAGGDRMGEIIADLFRIPQRGAPISVVDLSGIPSEVVNSVASVLCRLAFDLAVASQGAIQTLVVCEEAHRYIPSDPEAGFWPTRQAIARIAKEGRKYGVYLGIITQRPSELDPTIFSQCNTVFAMRLANQRDQRIIAGAMTNGAQTSVNFLSSIANRECIAFGEALKTPMRLTFETIARELLPGRHIADVQEAVRGGKGVDLAGVIRRMRETEKRAELDDEEEFMALTAGLPQREPTAPPPAPAGRFTAAAAAPRAPTRSILEDAGDQPARRTTGAGGNALLGAFRMRS
ncbi:MAG: ATPase [Alphaproteobacteria bacterium]|nr:MAG: ATPase [Alphaproteobacteria bacterium]